METRKLNVSFGKSGSGNITPRLIIPKKWINEMGIELNNREVIASFDGERIIIEHNDGYTTTLYDGRLATKNNVLDMMKAVDQPDDMTDEEKSVIRRVAAQNYDGCDEDLDELIEILNRKTGLGFDYIGFNLQTCYDILSKGNWYYMENKQCE